MHHKNVCLYIGNSSIKSDNNNKIEAEQPQKYPIKFFFFLVYLARYIEQ